MTAIVRPTRRVRRIRRAMIAGTETLLLASPDGTYFVDGTFAG